MSAIITLVTLNQAANNSMFDRVEALDAKWIDVQCQDEDSELYAQLKYLVRKGVGDEYIILQYLEEQVGTPEVEREAHEPVQYTTEYFIEKSGQKMTFSVTEWNI